MKVKRKPIEMLDKNENCRHNESLFSTSMTQCSKMLRRCNRMMADAGVYENLRATANHLKANPVHLVICVVIAVSLAIPLSIFVLFAVVNVAFAFTSFVVIEVTVLSIATAILCCILFCIMSTLTAIGVCVALIYYVTRYVSSFVEGRKAKAKHAHPTPKVSGASSLQQNSEKAEPGTKARESTIVSGKLSPVGIKSVIFDSDLFTKLDLNEKKDDELSTPFPSSDESM